ncbi:Myb/SANT-like domain [Macleaya cordata]|uniref:Myb/SANT-like domain n=1 Tax=Macleaya cordata TaxID=56857 RepID=A0A200Q5B9_MACCD|nr:Myb/SANT-like domain [Macleaya cordata]OVA06384.1 Myb/SANT-like domain [Macleaya cordata]
MAGTQSRAHWTPELHKTFVYLCLEQVQKGNRPGTHLNKDGYKVLCDKFFTLTKKQYDRKKMKNHWDTTKEMWKVWHKLISNTGSGWDPVTQTITAGNDWWDDYIKMNPKAADFRHAGLPFAVELDYIFGGITATGDVLFQPNSNRMPSFAEDLGSRPSVDAQINDTPDTVHETQQLSSEDDADVAEQNEIQRGTRHPTNEKRRRRLSGASRISTTMEKLVDAVENRTKSIEKVYTIKECIEALGDMADVIPVGCELYFAAVESFMDKDVREVFMSLPVEVRFEWLQRRHQT